MLSPRAVLLPSLIAGLLAAAMFPPLRAEDGSSPTPAVTSQSEEEIIASFRESAKASGSGAQADESRMVAQLGLLAQRGRWNAAIDLIEHTVELQPEQRSRLRARLYDIAPLSPAEFLARLSRLATPRTRAEALNGYLLGGNPAKYVPRVRGLLETFSAPDAASPVLTSTERKIIINRLNGIFRLYNIPFIPMIGDELQRKFREEKEWFAGLAPLLTVAEQARLRSGIAVPGSLPFESWEFTAADPGPDPRLAGEMAAGMMQDDSPRAIGLFSHANAAQSTALLAAFAETPTPANLRSRFMPPEDFAKNALARLSSGQLDRIAAALVEAAISRADVAQGQQWAAAIDDSSLRAEAEKKLPPQ